MEEFQKYFFQNTFHHHFLANLLFFVAYSILTGQTKVEFVIYLVLKGFLFFVKCRISTLLDSCSLHLGSVTVYEKLKSPQFLYMKVICYEIEGAVLGHWHTKLSMIFLTSDLNLEPNKQ